MVRVVSTSREKFIRSCPASGVRIGDFIRHPDEDRSYLFMVSKIEKLPENRLRLVLCDVDSANIYYEVDEKEYVSGISREQAISWPLADDTELAPKPLKDSGERMEFASGMIREPADNRVDYTLLDLDFMTRCAWNMTNGAKKYARDNWRKANSEDELIRYRASAFRHFIQWLQGEADEDHAAAVVFNLSAAEHVMKKLDNAKAKKEKHEETSW